MKKRALALALLASLVIACSETREPEGCPATLADCPKPSGRSGSPVEQLIQTYAPVIYLREQAHECDRAGAGYEPKPVELVLGNPEVVLRAKDGNVLLTGPLAADLREAPAGAYLDFPGNPLRPGCRYERDGRRFGAGLADVVYARIARQEGYEGIAVQYWFFYYFNDWNNKHEGDWEMIQLVFAASSAAGALAQEPTRVSYSQHSGGEIALWTDKKLRREGTHPVVYVAAGSQANFFGPHIYIGRAEQGAGLGCDDASPPHRKLVPEVVLIPEDWAAEEAFAWVGYRGRWGEVVGREFDGPTGPVTKAIWREPFSTLERLRYASVRAPSREVFGPNAVQAFCDTIAFTTDLFLPVILALPMVAALVAGAAGLGIVVALTRTRYVPIQARPLRARRRIGQILLSALEVYRRRARLFFGIGLVFVPVALLLSVGQWLFLRLSPIEPLVPVPTNNIGQQMVVLFALAELELGPAYALVVAATTAGLASYEAGAPLSVRESFRRVLRCLHLLVPVRLAAIVVIGGLAFTVVGIPVALRQAVRWTFLEQVVLLDGVSGLAAFRASSAAVAADWWWSAAATLALGGLGLVAAPAWGVVLILAFTSLPLFWVNLVTSVVYVALVPYVAICLAMVYFDLKARRSASA